MTLVLLISLSVDKKKCSLKLKRSVKGNYINDNDCNNN